MDHMVHTGQRPHGAGHYMGMSGTGRAQSWEVTGTKAMAAYSHHRSPVTCCLPDSGLGPCHEALRGQGLCLWWPLSKKGSWNCCFLSPGLFRLHCDLDKS